MSITINVVNLNPAQARCTRTILCDKFVSDFLRVLRFPPPIKLTTTI